MTEVRSTDHLTWVLEKMPTESANALHRFTALNQSWVGARWDDCLEALLDADAHLEVTEPLYDNKQLAAMGRLPAAVAVTLVWASPTFASAQPEVQLVSVAATITGNGGPTDTAV